TDASEVVERSGRVRRRALREELCIDAGQLVESERDIELDPRLRNRQSGCGQLLVQDPAVLDSLDRAESGKVRCVRRLAVRQVGDALGFGRLALQRNAER